MTRAIAEAARRNAGLVVFPAGSVSEAVRGRRTAVLEQVCAGAGSHKITVVFGMPRRENGRAYNSAVVAGPDGAILTRYDQLSARPPGSPGGRAAARQHRAGRNPGIRRGAAAPPNRRGAGVVFNPNRHGQRRRLQRHPGRPERARGSPCGGARPATPRYGAGENLPGLLRQPRRRGGSRPRADLSHPADSGRKFPLPAADRQLPPGHGILGFARGPASHGSTRQAGNRPAASLTCPATS